MPSRPLTVSAGDTRLDRSAADKAEEGKRRLRRIRQSETVQALVRILRPANIYWDIRELARETRNEIEIGADRLDASEAAFQAKRTDDVHKKLELLLIAERLYGRAVRLLDEDGDGIVSREEMSNHIKRALDGVRTDIEELEERMIADVFQDARLKVESAQINFISEDTKNTIDKQVKNYSIERKKYKFLAGACVALGCLSGFAAFAFPPTAPVTVFVATAVMGWGGRMWYKSRTERMKMIAAREACDDRMNRLVAQEAAA